MYETTKITALQQEIEQLEFHPKLSVFWCHSTRQKSKNQSRKCGAKGRPQTKSQKKAAPAAQNSAESNDNWLETEAEMTELNGNTNVFAPKMTVGEGLDNDNVDTTTNTREKKMTGWPLDPLLDKLVQLYVDEVTLREKWRCIGGCSGALWSNQSKPRILAHTVSCPKLLQKLRNKASFALAMSSKGRAVEEMNGGVDE